MEKIKYYIEKNKLLIFVVFGILALIASIIYAVSIDNKVVEVESVQANEEIIEEKEEDNELKKVKIDIKGYVKDPGVYEMDNDSRVIDVINKAGGLIENANTEYINLSKKVVDEMVIIIYSNSEVDKFKETNKETIYIEYECICPDNKNDACINKNDTVNTNGIKKDSNNSRNNTSVSNEVSINSGTLEELMTLDGIGESKARAIIEYREKNGFFKDLEEIKNVSGIGEAAYSKIKDNIKL